jgi:hypothetical protein
MRKEKSLGIHGRYYVTAFRTEVTMPRVVCVVIHGSLTSHRAEESPGATFVAKDEAVLTNVNRTGMTQNHVADCTMWQVSMFRWPIFPYKGKNYPLTLVCVITKYIHSLHLRDLTSPRREDLT